MDKSLIALVRLGINKPVERIPNTFNWQSIYTLASEQGLLAIVLDGIERITESLRPPQGVMLQWIGEVLQNYESRYVDYENAIGKLAAFYNSHGIKMMLIKGYGLGLNYPNPKHRPCGDIDTWNFGRQKEADAILSKEKGVYIDNSHRHHTVFDWKGYMVENHYDILTIDANKTNMILEPILKDCAMDDSKYMDIGGEKVFLPSANFNALYLLRHMLMHFVGTKMNIRQLIDWGFFWEKYGGEVDKEWLNDLLEKHHMTVFYNIINGICVDDLGFQSGVFPKVQYNPFIKGRVLNEIFQPEFDWTKAHDKNVFKRILFKFKRWKGGAWKRELCCGEGALESFVWSVRSHLLKPASI
jgi:hypothetical protein